MTTCSVEDCEKPTRTRGWCNRHYQRWLKHGDPLATLAYRDGPEAAFLARTEPLVWSSCIIWTGGTNRYGYGQLRVNGRQTFAHRYAWERVNGPIPDGLMIDHRCFERSCVNVEHLRIATRYQNSQHRSGPTRRSSTGVRGVSKNGNRFRAVVVANGTRHHLGSFGTVEEASAAAQTKRAILFGDFAGRA